MPSSVVLVSDSTGETVEHLAQAALSQFNVKNCRIRRYRNVNAPQKVEHVIDDIGTENAFIICTLVSRSLRSFLIERAAARGLVVVDLMGPVMTALEEMLHVVPLEQPGLLRQMDDQYFDRVKALEYAIKCDDGKSPELLFDADLVILGVSRSGKTPLSMFLANKGYKVANIPLVPEIEPSDNLFSIPSEKIVGLLIQAEELMKIRHERLKILGLDPAVSAYAQEQRVLKELTYAQDIMRRLGCRIFDVTDRAIEQSAQDILDYIRRH